MNNKLSHLIKYTFLVFLSSAFSHNSHAIDFSYRFNLQNTNTNNVNLNSSDPIADRYRTVSLSAQAKKDKFAARLKLKIEKYKITKENDNYSLNLNTQYQPTKLNQFNIDVFKVTYNGTPSVSTDATNDNRGFKLSANFSNEFTNKFTGYIGPSAIYKKYTKVDNRTDKNLGITLGADYDYSDKFYINPEFNFLGNKSSDTYYSYLQYTPSLYLGYFLTEEWELRGNLAYSRTQYTNRYVGTTNQVRPNEIQSLITKSISTAYTLNKMFIFDLKYIKDTNYSNNATAKYDVDEVSLNFGLKY